MSDLGDAIAGGIGHITFAIFFVFLMGVVLGMSFFDSDSRMSVNVQCSKGEGVIKADWDNVYDKNGSRIPCYVVSARD